MFIINYIFKTYKKWIKVAHSTINKIILNKFLINRLTIKKEDSTRIVRVKINNQIQKFLNLHQVFISNIVRILR